MPLFVLDTDHVSLLQRGHPRVGEHVSATAPDDIAGSIVTYEEQLRGRLDVVRRAANAARLSIAYLRLREMHEFFCAIRILDFNAEATTIYERLRRQLRIAATTLAVNGTLVTRNMRDFALIANLPLEDWSAD